ncbi:MAG: YggS family pyridoxal phosphate-dependent enzyme [Bacteroidales bacterium]
MSIAGNIEKIRKEIPENVTLIAVSKTKPVGKIREAYDSEHKVFGENKVQELTGKAEALPDDIDWHMIGHLQTNKVKYIAPFVSLIHSVDSMKLLREINKQALNKNRVIRCLLQMKIAREESKFGLFQDEAIDILASEEYKSMTNVNIVGLMGMASFVEDTDTIRDEFKKLVSIFKKIKMEYFSDKPGFREISMGMSSDYKIAIEEGATMIRIGSLIFGERIYQ